MMVSKVKVMVCWILKCGEIVRRSPQRRFYKIEVFSAEPN